MQRSLLVSRKTWSLTTKVTARGKKTSIQRRNEGLDSIT